MNLGSEIRKAAIDNGKALQEIAKQAGMKRTYFSRRLNGHTDFNVSEICAIAAVLNLTGSELLRRAEQANNQ